MFTILQLEGERNLFGYIKPDKPELKIKEYQYFRSYYCGLCKALGKNLGQPSRFTVSYDLAFAALLFASLHDGQDEIASERCIADPIHKKPIIKNNRFVDYAADMNIILMYHKLLDDWHNDHSLPAKTAAVALYRGFKSAKLRYPDKSQYIAYKLGELDVLEKARCDVVDEAAEPFAGLLREILTYPWDDIPFEQCQYLQDMAYDLGRWIYILDAYDDVEKDASSGNYNPMLLQFHYEGQDIKEFKASIKDWVEFNLTYTLSKVEESYRLLDIKRNKAILDNFIYLGLYKSMSDVLKV